MNDPHSRWPHRWLNSKARPYHSTIAGTGIISANKINAGEIIAGLGGSMVHRSQIKKYQEEMGHVGVQVDDDFFIVPTTREELERNGVFNHSCEPNVGYATSVTLRAIKDIEPEQELVFDYAFSETSFETFSCNCKTASCRKTISPDDWKKPEIQQKYRDFYSPYLQKKLK